MQLLMLFVAGCFVGMVGAFLGIGGGVIIIPLLTIGFGYPIHEAVATSLAIVVANSVVASWKYLKDGMANLKVALPIAFFSVMGSIAGGVISVNIPARALYITLGCAQLATLFFMWIKDRIKRKAVPEERAGFFKGEYYDLAGAKKVRYTVTNLPPTLGISGLSGVLSGLVGVGGGVIIVPVMNIISNIPIKAATATSALIMGFTAAGGGIIFFLSGYTRPDVIAAMVPAIFISSFIASGYMNRINSQTLYKVFMVFLFLVACQMLWRGIYGT